VRDHRRAFNVRTMCCEDVKRAITQTARSIANRALLPDASSLVNDEDDDPAVDSYNSRARKSQYNYKGEHSRARGCMLTASSRLAVNFLRAFSSREFLPSFQECIMRGPSC